MLAEIKKQNEFLPNENCKFEINENISLKSVCIAIDLIQRTILSLTHKKKNRLCSTFIFSRKIMQITQKGNMNS